MLFFDALFSGDTGLGGKRGGCGGRPKKWIDKNCQLISKISY